MVYCMAKVYIHVQLNTNIAEYKYNTRHAVHGMEERRNLMNISSVKMQKKFNVNGTQTMFSANSTGTFCVGTAVKLRCWRQFFKQLCF